MLEKTFVKKYVEPFLKKEKFWYFINEPTYSIRGYPDLIICSGGTLCGLEAKRSLQEFLKNSPRTVLQRVRLQQLRAEGGFGTFVFPENWEVVQEALMLIRHHQKSPYHLID